MISNNRNKKAILVYNPNSGAGIFKNSIDDIIRIFQEQGVQIVPIRATTVDVFERFLSKMEGQNYQQEYEKVLVAGGDGTLNICVNSMKKYHIRLPIGLFPVGTANDVAGSFGIEMQDFDVMDIIEKVAGDNTVDCDIGKVNERYFVSSLSVGAIAQVSQSTDELFKNTMGIFSYYYTAFTKVSNITPFHARVTIDGKELEDEVYCIIVMNCKSSRGFKNISPKAVPNDGKFEVIMFKNRKAFRKTITIMHLLKKNSRNDEYIFRGQGANIKIELEKEVPIDIDGERFNAQNLDIEVVSRGIRILA